MTAGRELDALIAEKVMGWVRRGTGFPITDPAEWAMLTKTSSFSYLKGVEAPPDYSTSIAAAWEVVERFQFCYLYRASDMSDGKWECKLRREDDGRKYYVLADTAPLAICLAALKAVGCELSQETA